MTTAHGDTSMLRSITSPADVKALSVAQLHELCDEIRSTLLDYGHAHGGHIGSNLGLVEATVALHYVFDSPRDRFVFDVSHQTYVHKMLTGRAAAYLDSKHFDDVTGFTNPAESEYDQFVLGHTGTSVSLACGLAKSRDMQTDSSIGNVVAVIGDGSLSSGVAFEGLNNAAEQGGNLIIVVNDNEMSIAGDFGGMYGPLAALRASGGTAEPNLFHALGLDYRYVENGNDVDALIAAFKDVRDIDHPVVVHIHTLKGAGYDDETADGTSERSHADACDLSDAAPHAGQCEASHWQAPDSALNCPDDPRKYYGKLAMAALEPRFASEPGLVVISPATPGSNGITHEFRERAGAHYVDTGITESHAVAYAAGIAKAGGVPVVATTASFFQRAYDQLMQEMSLNAMRVVLLDFLGGLSGSDNTHSGAYDVAMFANIPGLTMLVPTSKQAFLDDLNWATAPSGGATGPVAIRVPGEHILDAEREGRDLGYTVSNDQMLRYHTAQRGSGAAILALGNTYPLAFDAAQALGAKGITPTIIDPRQCTELDEAALEALRADHDLVITLEDGQLSGGWGQNITAYYANQRDEDGRNPQVLNFGAAKEFTDREPLDSLDVRYGLTVDTIVSACSKK